MLGQTTPSRIECKLKQCARMLVALLMLKVLGSIVLEYRWYFPANFEATFLIGREQTFRGLYAAAFYTHILAGPTVVLFAAGLMWSGKRARYPALHRWAGRGLALLILATLVPSGLVMATQSLAGPLAAIGFASLALATGASAVALVYYARSRQFVLHERWATRCFILLLSPLILRVVGGAFSVLELHAPPAYILNAWLSWLVPLVIYEAWWRAALLARSPRHRTAFANEAMP